MMLKNYTIFLAALLIGCGWAASLKAQTQLTDTNTVIEEKERILKNSKEREEYWQGRADSAIYYLNGYVGIGTATPEADLHVQGNMKMGSNIGTVGTNAFAGGEENQASGQSAFSYGKLNQANGPFSIALGRESKALDHAAIALGYHAEAKVGNTIAIGKFVESTSSSAITIGSGTGTGSNMLKNNFSHSLMLGFYSNLPTFFVSSSEGAGTTGNIGIGNMTDPQAKLHIYSDMDKAATLKLEHRTTGTNRYAEIGLGTHSIRAGNTENMVFKTPTSRHFVFENGNVGIGLAQPEASLHVQGNMKVGTNIGEVGDNAFAGGEESVASGTNSFAFGRESKATHMNAVAIGFKAEATSEMAVAIGYINKARAESTYLFGERLSAGSSGAFVIGRGASSENSLQNNVNSSLMIGFNSTVPTFFVSQSSGAGTTGRIGIGNMTDPQAKLHILADEGEAASLRLEHQAAGENRYAELALGNHTIRAGNFDHMTFTTPANKHFVFENGNVGIGADNPVSSLHVHDEEEALITLSNNQGKLIMALATNPWLYAPTSQPGDAVFKTNHNDDHHGMIFNMNDDFNDGNSYIKFNDNYNHHTLTILNNGHIGFGTDKPKARIHLEDGDIYLHDIQSGIIMKSPDGQCWRGRLNEQGTLIFTAIDCPTEGVNSQPELNTSLPIWLFPNPTSGKLTITHEFTQGPIEALVYNLEGALLLHRQFDAKVFDLSLEHLVAGTYIVSLKHQNQVVASEKVVKK
ncbi:MAG: T9SS type A sorting domain-containing protein [Bacteroidetes bacterium]|nr:T9SS type A sorting domain-containing protein [Bacteroidota bacterium]